MEENTSIFSQAKIEYTQQLIDVLTPNMFDGIRSIYDESKTYFSTQTSQSILNIFRRFLEKVPEWNNEIVEKETERIIFESKCDWLDDLVTAVFISHTKILTSIGPNFNNARINLTIPKTINFIHKCYINLAREIWKNPYLFYENVSGSEYQRNMRTIETIIKDNIEQTVRKLLPVKQILKEHLDNFDNNNQEVQKNLLQEELLKEIRELKNLNKQENDSPNEDNSVNDDDDNNDDNNVEQSDSPNNDSKENLVLELMNEESEEKIEVSNNHSGYESPDEEKIKQECDNIEITTVPDILSNENEKSEPPQEIKYDNVDIVNPEKTNSDLMDKFKDNVIEIQETNTNEILSPRVSNLEESTNNNNIINNDPLFPNTPFEPINEVNKSEIEHKPISEIITDEKVKDPNIKDVVMNKSIPNKDIKEITIVKKDNSKLGLIEETKESVAEPIEKFNEETKEKEMKEIIKVEKNTDETETVDNFIDDIANLMENKGINVDKETKSYTLFDDAEENE